MSLNKAQKVSKWLCGIGLEYAISEFQRHGITTPEKLASLDLQDFEEVGVTETTDRKKLFYLIQRIRMAVNENENTNSSRRNTSRIQEISTSTKGPLLRRHNSLEELSPRQNLQKQAHPSARSATAPRARLSSSPGFNQRNEAAKTMDHHGRSSPITWKQVPPSLQGPQTLTSSMRHYSQKLKEGGLSRSSEIVDNSKPQHVADISHSPQNEEGSSSALLKDFGQVHHRSIKKLLIMAREEVTLFQLLEQNRNSKEAIRQYVTGVQFLLSRKTDIMTNLQIELSKFRLQLATTANVTHALEDMNSIRSKIKSKNSDHS